MALLPVLLASGVRLSVLLGAVPAGALALLRAGVPARPGRHARRHSRQQGFPTVGGQHDAFARGLRRGLLALSTLRHRDSYEWGTFGIVGSRYRVP
ncbi:hypothetical protein GCM10010269_32900 [Streptomyces humidus]|uniref:Uncharacterized protein n=1 Tax=Streptomyces humidus TaxID=52259 RepID=A0A918FWB7_9ACTN|nr:hypothetical protein GCM10010269_32900 [Streptomyces humidus]